MKTRSQLKTILLSSVAVAIMATGAQADQLSDFKAQLEALKSRINTLETTPNANLPEGTNLITFARGQGTLSKRRSKRQYSRNRGFTIAITPTADLPAPVTEITVSGYTAGLMSYTSEGGSNASTFDMTAFNGASPRNEWDLDAQAGLVINAKTQTSVGEIRAEMEFSVIGAGGAPLEFVAGFGEWDFAPGWTFTAGLTAQTMDLPIGVDTVDDEGAAGFGSGEVPQIKFTYTTGPITVAVGVEDPTNGGANYPNLAAFLQYESSGGHQIFAGATVADWGPRTGWAIGGGANIKLGDVFMVSAGGAYGKGYIGEVIAQHTFDAVDAFGNPYEAFGITAGASASLTETTTVNVMWGYSDTLETAATTAIGGNTLNNVHTIHANLIWQPVDQMKLGFEAIFGRNTYFNGTTNNVVRGVFGATYEF